MHNSNLFQFYEVWQQAKREQLLHTLTTRTIKLPTKNLYVLSDWVSSRVLRYSTKSEWPLKWHSKSSNFLKHHTSFPLTVTGACLLPYILSFSINTRRWESLGNIPLGNFLLSHTFILRYLKLDRYSMPWGIFISVIKQRSLQCPELF